VRLAIRVDASQAIGAGHAMRCITLAKALTDAFKANNIQLDVVAVSTENANILEAAFEREGISTFYVPHVQSNVSHFNADIWIVDHYQLDANFENELVDDALVVVIDDLANRKHNCHLLVDANLSKHASERYTSLVTQNCVQLIGPKYALLREEFYQAHKGNITRKPKHLLICFGGSDPTNTTSTALQALTQVKEIGLTADVVIGAGNIYKQSVVEQARLIDGITVHINSESIAELMCKASLMVGAGGSMHWERCVCNLPGIIITIADNQREATEYLASIGGCDYLGHVDSVTSDDIVASLRSHFSTAAEKLDAQTDLNKIVPLDGGASLVSKEIMSLFDNRDNVRGSSIEKHYN
jgi:UDP-2,4-diacetamido-2,4,6-trideoxy-beta-L-altropyranose hydrolase